MATITYNVPIRDGAIEQRQGSIAYFDIGGQRIKFVLQHDSKGTPRDLVHFASGMRLGGYTAVGRMTRKWAERQVARAIESKGVDTVLATLNSAPILNS